MTNRPDPYRNLNKKLELRRSEIQGNGLFAKEKIKKGEVIWKEDESVVSNATHSIFSLAEIEKWDAKRKDWWLHYAYQVDDDKMEGPVDAAHLEDDYAAYYNHNCDANTWFGTEDGEDTDFVISARRDIEPGEEITYDYATSESYHLKFSQCRCTAANCRKNISTEDWKRPDVQKQYGRHFVSYLLRRIDVAAK